MVTRHTSDSEGEVPRLSTNADSIGTMIGSLLVLGFASRRCRPATVAWINGEEDMGGCPDNFIRPTALTASLTADLDFVVSSKCCKYKAKCTTSMGNTATSDRD